jgi:hypothetical protein
VAREKEKGTNARKNRNPRRGGGKANPFNPTNYSFRQKCASQ